MWQPDTKHVFSNKMPYFLVKPTKQHVQWLKRSELPKLQKMRG